MVALSAPPELEPAPREVASAAAPTSLVVSRQLRIWPFAPRSVRLLLLVDPSRADAALTRGLLRAMQHCCLGLDTGSQTNAIRAAVHAVHYVLRHHNHQVLPEAHVTAATAVAAVRGPIAYVALSGEAAALAWGNGRLTGQRTLARGSRPLGQEQQPRVTLWSTPLRRGDSLVLVCGARWGPD
ncbi:MAG: hypothetical protein M3336_10600, partial [Chloroflexota bacterium]|nr:hypothetical protein [Chloroflexota bacterium]